MSLIIDGYNLLNVTGITGARGDLHSARQALLRFLAAAIEGKERPRTTIVFDAASAPPGLPREMLFEGITVRFASNYDDADELIEELIGADYAPRSLLVVSSDHRIQRAARRRRARFVDSDAWFVETLRRQKRSTREPSSSTKATGTLTAEEMNYWLGEFAEAPDPQQSQNAPSRREPAARDPAVGGVEHPFPPGYGEDLLEGQGET